MCLSNFYCSFTFYHQLLKLIDINQTEQCLFKKKNIEDAKISYLVGGLGDVFLCKLNVCLHKAGNPIEGHTTNLIMIQLNPSRKWYLNEYGRSDTSCLQIKTRSILYA